MSDKPGKITSIAGQLAQRMPTRGVSEEDATQAIRHTLHYAKEVGILDELTDTIEGQASGDPAVSALLDSLRETTDATS